jgi:hypothetical protein
MADTEKTPATLLDELVALDQAQRCEVAEELRKVAESFAEVPDGRHIAQHSGCWPTSSTRSELSTHLYRKWWAETARKRANTGKKTEKRTEKAAKKAQKRIRTQFA